MSTDLRPSVAGPPAVSAERECVLSVRDLRTRFRTLEGTVRAVDGLTFDLHRGEALGVVGESGCGKSVAALSIMRLVEEPPGEVQAETLALGEVDLLALSEPQMRRIRGNDISMIFQEPMTSLNPVLTIGRQITEAVVLHQGLSAHDARAKAQEMLQLVHISEPARRLGEYPFQLSGGMRQRVMIAMALSCNPKVLIADEATTALDVTIQAQILELINEMRARLGTAVVLITHDLGVVAETAERVVVMYAGRKVEEASVDDLFARPLHPYTRGLLASVPDLGQAIAGPVDGATAVGPRKRLSEIPGIVPALTNLPPGCTFAARCAHATDVCRERFPALEEHGARHWVACHEARRLAGATDV